MKDDKSFAYRLGQAFGIVLVACLTVCLGAAVVALTMKFLQLIL